MDLQTAINHAIEKAGSCQTECQREHKQLAVWLQELQQFKAREYADLLSSQAATMKWGAFGRDWQQAAWEELLTLFTQLSQAQTEDHAICSVIVRFCEFCISWGGQSKTFDGAALEQMRRIVDPSETFFTATSWPKQAVSIAKGLMQAATCANIAQLTREIQDENAFHAFRMAELNTLHNEKMAAISHTFLQKIGEHFEPI